MVGPFGAKADAGSISQPERAVFGVSGRNLRPLASPDAFDPLVVDHAGSGGSIQVGNVEIKDWETLRTSLIACSAIRDR